MTRSCILVLSGLPASGKSTCACRLKSWAKADSEGRGTVYGSGDFTSLLPAAGTYDGRPDGQGAHQQRRYRFYHIAYDDIMPTDVETKLLDSRNYSLGHGPPNGEKESSQWKNYRKEIVKCVGKHLAQYTLVERWEELTQESPDAMVWEMFLKCLSGEWTEPAPEGHKSMEVETDTVYIIDDNMYYQSMRFEYYQLARKYNTGFAQVYFDSSVELAQRRNILRPSPVHPEIIDAMANRLEPPGSPEPCDKHVLVVQAEHDGDRYIPAVLLLVAAAVEDPVLAAAAWNEEARAAARVTCSTNLIHQSDQTLRQLVANTMSQAKDNGLETEALRNLAAKMNGARQRLLNDMRQGRLLVDSDLNEEVHAGRITESVLFKFVKTMLDRELDRTEMS